MGEVVIAAQIRASGLHYLCMTTKSIGALATCTLTASDGGVRSIERSKQEAIDTKRKHDNQPATAPAL